MHRVGSDHRVLCLTHTRCCRRPPDMHGQLAEMVASVQRTETDIERRLAALEGRIKRRVSAVEEAQSEAALSWVYPFLLVVAVAIGAGLILANRMRRLSKIHLP